MCDYRCCTYTDEFVVNGECVEMSEFTRCEDRKKHHRIALFVLLSILIITIFVCSFLKKKEAAKRKQALEQIKVRSAHEENIQNARSASDNTGTQQKGHRRVTSNLTGTQPQIDRAKTVA